MGGGGCLGGGLQVVYRFFLYSSCIHLIFVLYLSFGMGRIDGAWGEGGFI